jgi:hypothetical protein
MVEPEQERHSRFSSGVALIQKRARESRVSRTVFSLIVFESIDAQAVSMLFLTSD